MSRSQQRLAEEHAKAAKWKEKHQLLKARYEALKQKHAALKLAGKAPVGAAPGSTSLDFVRKCYQSLLGRAVSDLELHHPSGYAAALDAGVWTREQVMWAIVGGEEFASRSQTAEFVPAGHFYSALPGPDDRQRAIQARSAQRGAELQMNAEGQKQLMEAFLQYRGDCPLPAAQQEGSRYCFENESFAWLDGFLLHAMLRHHRPKRVIEIGSGRSSALMLDMRDHLPESKMELTFVDPYADMLRSLMKPGDAEQVRILESPVQSIDPILFHSLKAGDILFIDSTHVSKCASDVNHLFFEVLPALEPGVIVHLHDIFYPWEYPTLWIAEGRAWNELYLLRAFLQHNDRYRVLISSSFVQHQFGTWMRQNIPEFATHSGGSFWMQKQ
ncbi:MAG TPA: class I SAM-dependent methyltransferase [Verrucomicrobium sp.]|nr:class I SAM-dependent methyltransferase [Verrucomicrobium sp.]